MNMLTDFLHKHVLAVAIAVAAMCVITFLAFVIDKIKAMNSGWRIPERTLLTLCFFYGALGGMLAMYFMNHKTRKPKFYCLVPLFLAIQIILGCIVYM